MSYFAKPNFINYDEWFDDDLEKNKDYLKYKKIKSISKVHNFFYEQSNYKVGASENNLQLDNKVNEKKLITSNYVKKPSEKYTSATQNKFIFIHKIHTSKLKFIITKRIYFLFIFSFLLIIGFVIFLISSSKKSATNTFNSLEKEFYFTRKDY